MSKRIRRQFTPDFKASTVALVVEQGQSVSQVCRDLDLAESAYRRWIEKAQAGLSAPARSVPVMSQTLISIARLDQGAGRIESNDLVKVTASAGAHTVFVYDGAENFRSDAGKLVVTGEYVSKSDPAEIRKPFTFAIPINNTLR